MNYPQFSRLMRSMFFLVWLVFIRPCYAHVAAWHKGMYCLNGTQEGVDDQNNALPCNPLFNLTREDWWFHHVDNCDQFPPADGDFLELPAGGTVTVEHAVNRAFTTLSYDSANIGLFPDGEEHPGLGETDDGKSGDEGCIVDPNIHTQNETMAAGTAFAISYTSSISDVTPENLVVFSVLYNTPWHRIATYNVPNLPACPDGGCICAWGWVANGCGEPNMYMQGFRCRVVGATGSAKLATASPPVWCEDDTSKCVGGAKQMVFWNQQDGNNIEVSGNDLSGQPRSPTYNAKLGFKNGSQDDIFLDSGTASTTSIAPSPTTSAGGESQTPGSSSNARKNVPVLLSWFFLFGWRMLWH
ncbi:hypothetical protein BDQ17DRAFT_1342697 [Cyathus striatus]|nr:hypothetical protein BDQ17DRAFT_1342697 [Cyathus striatus]